MPRSRIILIATAVAVCYYGGALVGLGLRLPGSTPSIMWPPNAILTATLLLTNRRHWMVYLLAAFPAHLLVELPTGWRLPMVLLLFLTNCSEGLVGAWLVRRYSDAPGQLDTLRRLTVFLLGAAVASPVITSFADAAVVAWLQGESYAGVWKTRVLSNMLTELTVVPALMTVATSVMNWPWHAPVNRRVEALTLALSLAGVSLLVVTARAESFGVLTTVLRAPIVLMLPLVLWAAARFGPGGTSLALLGTTLTVMWSAMRAPLTLAQAVNSVPSLQIILIVVSVPLMCLAALMEERRQGQLSLVRRLRFEEFLSGLSGSLIRFPGHHVSTAFDDWLEQLGRFLALDRLLLYLRAADGRDFVLVSGWASPELGPIPQFVLRREFPWAVERLLAGDEVIVPSPDHLPREAAKDRASFDRYGFNAAIALPLRAGDRVMGVLSLTSVGCKHGECDELVAHLRLVAEVLTGALARQQSEDALRESEETKSAILSSLTSGVAVIDAQGRVIAVNDIWGVLARESDLAFLVCNVDVDMLKSCQQTAAAGHRTAMDIAEGIAGILARRASRTVLQYTSHTSQDPRWWVLVMAPLNREEGGAVITYNEITERKRAELDVQRARAELAHLTRVSTMGELTASLAHQINQPLTGILSNAQAGRRLLDAAKPPLDPIRAILSDIIQDSRRAGDIIQQTRELLRKGEPESAPVHLNALVRGVVSLVESDAIMRQVALTLELEAERSIVQGDRVQLEQVVLNLLLNAFDAVGERPVDERRVRVDTRLDGRAYILVSVEDSGPGIPADSAPHIFDAFYTTKKEGMGMGLSIARSLVEAHGGAIRARSNGQSTTVSFTLPLAGAGR
jgi:two-component system sensor kinase FixL